MFLISQSNSNVLAISGKSLTLILNSNPLSGNSGALLWQGLNVGVFNPLFDLDQNAVSFQWDNNGIIIYSVLKNMSQLQGQYYINATGTSSLKGFSINASEFQNAKPVALELPAGKEAYEWQDNTASYFIKDLSIANYSRIINSANFVSTVGTNGFVINNASVFIDGNIKVGSTNYIVFTSQDSNNVNEQICVSDISSVYGQFDNWSQFANMYCCAVLPVSNMLGVPLNYLGNVTIAGKDSMLVTSSQSIEGNIIDAIYVLNPL